MIAATPPGKGSWGGLSNLPVYRPSGAEASDGVTCWLSEKGSGGNALLINIKHAPASRWVSKAPLASQTRHLTRGTWKPAGWCCMDFLRRGIWPCGRSCNIRRRIQEGLQDAV